jgi:hypothetical protein
LVVHCAELCLEATLLWRRQIFRQRKGRKLLETAAIILEPLLELDGTSRGRRGSWLSSAQPAGRRPQQLAALGLVRETVDIDQCQGLVTLQSVSVDNRKHGVLLPGRQCCQPVGQSRADAPASELPVGG